MLDVAAGNQLVLDNMAAAHEMARKWYIPNYDQEDKVQDAAVGLIVAARKFDPDRGFKSDERPEGGIPAHLAEKEMGFNPCRLVRGALLTAFETSFFLYRRGLVGKTWSRYGKVKGTSGGPHGPPSFNLVLRIVLQFPVNRAIHFLSNEAVFLLVI